DPLAAAQAALDAGRSDRALELVAQVLRKDPKNARALLLRSTAECLEGNLDRCRKDLDAALERDPELRQGWLNRSALAISDQRYDDALAALARAEALDPANPDNGLNQGAVLLLAGRLEPATEQFRRHLAAAGGGAEAWYLVATNYAFSGYAALAVEHLARAIELDERRRALARTDANFASLAGNRAFQQLMATDSFAPAPGAPQARRVLRTRYAGADSPVLTAVLNTVQLGGGTLDRLIEVTDTWAIVRSDFRIKLAALPDGTTAVELSAPPGAFAEIQWQSRTETFFTSLERELLRLELARGREPKQP
ncbi:MAG: tetratricopeptide repeat protein, partial [Thermoanaerobaculia bacterium]